MPLSNLLTGDTGSAISFDRAREFIKDCETLHDACDPGRDVPLPKRLVDLSAVYNNDGAPGVKLVETNGKIGKYACLSYCWVDPIHILSKTATASISEYLRFIP
jgi:hypothetical protein